MRIQRDQYCFLSSRNEGENINNFCCKQCNLLPLDGFVIYYDGRLQIYVHRFDNRLWKRIVGKATKILCRLRTL